MTADGNYIEGLDVKYLLGGGCETKIDPAIVSPIETLERGGRKRRSREFLMKREEDVKAEEKRNQRNRKDSTKQNNGKKSEVAAAVEEVKENLSSPQSSATVSTPHKRRMLEKIPTKVTPIPKMVTTKKKIDFVSPMTDDSLLSSSGHLQNDRRNKSVARGLVFDKIDEIDPQNRKTQIQSKILDVSSCASVAMNYSRRSQSKHQSKQEKDRISMHKKPVASTNFIAFQINRKKNCTSSETMKEVPSANRDNNNKKPHHQRNYVTSNTVGTNKKSVGVRLKTTGISNLHGVQFAAAKAQVSNRRYKPSASSSSFSRTKSAYDKNKNALSSKAVVEENISKNTNRKPLLDVYRREVEKAKEFMNEMVGHPTRHGIYHNANHGGRSAIAPSGLKENASFIRTNSKYDEFLSHVYEVWCKIDDEEVALVRFKEIFNKVTSNLFTDHELDKHVKLYCDEGKEVMLSDGTIYRIN